MSNRSTAWLTRTYFALSVVGLVTVTYLITRSLGVGAPIFDALFANWTSTTLIIDMLIAIAAAIVWVIAEARRLGMRWMVWLLLMVSTPIAFSLPLFLAFRERRLDATSRA